MGNRSILYELNIQLDTAAWGVSCPLDQNLIGPVGYGWDRFQKDPDSFVFGGGLLAGSPLPGTRRMIFCAYSPQWEGFYVSALGGAMYVFHRVGVNYVWMRGRCPQPSVVVIRLKDGETSVRIEPFDAQAAWDGYADAAGRTWEGFYGLQHAVFDRYKGEYDGDALRVLAVGPAAARTREGAIGSNQVRRGELSRIDDWAGRGGLGSRLYQHHNVAAVVFGGDWQDPALKEARELDQFFLDHFGQRAIASDLALSQKYRYVPEFETGGTFGVNMHTADDRLLSFNYTSIFASDQARLDQHQAFVKEHYLKQFNAECIQTKNFDHCGEPCAIACKKFTGEFKKDYEPYEALGPNSGIFDQRAAEMLNKFVDSMGLDSIQAGGTAAWIMELIAAGLIPAADFGLPAEGPRFTFASDPVHFRLEEDSLHNAHYAVAILRMILFQPQGAVFRRGIRAAAKALDRTYGIRSIDRAVYTAHGQEGSMVPNQYLVPGMFAPMPLMGKYFSYYEGKFYPPFELGKKNAERFVYELYSENSGACRFHRKWIEDIIHITNTQQPLSSEQLSVSTPQSPTEESVSPPRIHVRSNPHPTLIEEIIRSHFDLEINLKKTNFELAKAINDHQGGDSVFWESERTIDVIFKYLEYWEHLELKDPALHEWLARFRADKWKGASDYWHEILRGINEAFDAGWEAIPDVISHNNVISPHK